MNRDSDSKPITKPQFINLLVDTQNEPAELAVSAGVADLKVLYQNGKFAIPVSITIQTSTGLKRGVHMSRLVQAASSHESENIEKWLRQICSYVNRTQPGSIVTCRFEMPYSDQFVPVAIRATQRGASTYQFTAKGMTACPCSKEMIGIGHMQRAEIVLVLRSRKRRNLIDTIAMLQECFSAFPKEKMKRAEEAQKILEAQENPKFAEDLVRECVKRFPDAKYVQARCFESIHAHDAVASWSTNEGWIPAI